MDKQKMRKGDCAVRDTWKDKRKLKKRSKIKNQGAFQKSGSIQYQPQGFHAYSKNSFFL